MPNPPRLSRTVHRHTSGQRAFDCTVHPQTPATRARNILAARAQAWNAVAAPTTRHDPHARVARTATRARSSDPSCPSNARRDWRQSWHDGQPGAGAAGRRPEHRNHRGRPLRLTVGVQLEHADPLVATMHDAEPNPDTTSCAVEAAPRTCHSRRKAVWRRAGSGRPARPQSASGRARATAYALVCPDRPLEATRSHGAPPVRVSERGSALVSGGQRS